MQATSDPPVAGRYSPAADAWQAMPRIPGDPVIADTGFSTVWTGSQMILWGGYGDVTGTSNAGYRFSPATNSWSAITTTGAPAARQDHYAAMVGGEMIVWGGQNTAGNTILDNDGGRYNPTTNSWQGLSTTDAPAYRTEATVTAAGDKLIVWAGGLTSSDQIRRQVPQTWRNLSAGLECVVAAVQWFPGTPLRTHGRLDGQRPDCLGRHEFRQQRVAAGV